MTATVLTQKKLCISEKIEKTAIKLDFDDIFKTLEEKKEKSIKKNDGFVWINDKPEDLENIDKLLRSRYNLSDKLKSIVTYYDRNKIIYINSNDEKIFYRIFITNVNSYMSISFSDINGDPFELQKGYAYRMPGAASGVLQYEFNYGKIKPEAKKGQRNKTVIQRVDERRILVFDYFLSQKTLDKVNEECKKMGKKAEKLSPQKAKEILDRFMNE